MILEQRDGWAQPLAGPNDMEWLSRGSVSVIVHPEEPDMFCLGLHNLWERTDDQKLFLRFDTQDDACEVAELILSKWNR